MGWEVRRDFWIYLLVTLFVMIIGVYCLTQAGLSDLLPVALLWLIGVALSFMMAYHLFYSLTNEEKERSWFGNRDQNCCLIHIIYALILILSVLWTCLLSSDDLSNQMFPALLVILLVILLGTHSLQQEQISNHLSSQTWIVLGNVLVWLGLIILLLTHPV